jgi:MFS family permease
VAHGFAGSILPKPVKNKLPSAVYLLGLTSLLNDAASDMIYPLLPLFLMGITHSPGAGAAALGLIEGLAELVSALLKLVSGWASDRSGRRKPLVVAGYAVASAVRPLLALATSAAAVLAVRLVDRLGKGLRSSPRDAMIADAVHPLQRARAFGVHEAMDTAGAVMGPLAAAGLQQLGYGLPTVFLVSALPAAAACLVVGFAVREPPRQAPAVPQPVGAPAQRLPLSRPFLGYLAAVTVFSLAGSADAFLVMRAYQLGVSPVSVTLLWGLHNALKALAIAQGGIVADRFGRRRTLAAGWVIYALVYSGFALADGLEAVVVLFLVYSVHHGLVAGAGKALVADLVPPGARARGYGLYHLCVGLMLLPASVLFGLVYQRVGAQAAFAGGAGLALLAATLLPLSRVPAARR